MSRVEIFRGQPPRRWSKEEKRRLVAERHGVNTSQLFTWRKRLRARFEVPGAAAPPPMFASIQIADASPRANDAGLERDVLAAFRP
jgi:transposase-like protein